MRSLLTSSLLLLLALACGCATTGNALRDGESRLDGDVTEARVGDITVLVKRVPGAPFSAGRLHIRGGVRNWAPAQAGIEGLALAVAAEGGTESLDKEAFSQRLTSLGANINGGGGNDDAALTMKTLTRNWDATFPLLADVLLHPGMPESEVALQKQRALAGLKGEGDSGDGALSLLVYRTLFAQHPYLARGSGWAETVATFDRAALLAHLAKLREQKRLVFIAVGDLDPAHVIEQVKAAFGALPAGNYEETPLPALQPTGPRLVTQAKKLPTAYVHASAPAVGWSSPEFPAAVVTTRVLSWRLFEEVRTKRNLSYAPSARLSSGGQAPFGLLYVTATDPNTTFKVMTDEVRRIRTELVPEKELLGTKSVYLTGWVETAETVDGQAGLMASALFNGGDWRLSRTLIDRIRAVTAAEVQAYAQKHLEKFSAVVVATEPEKLDKAVFEGL